jgi:predicted nucleic acid-binding protein
MDSCCFNRPFDISEQERIFFETETILSIISRCDSGEWTLLASGTIYYELSQTSDEEIRENTLSLFSVAKEKVKLTAEQVERAKHFQKFGIKHFDSLHLALAEKAEADVLLTTDDKFIKATKKTDAKVRVQNPANWLMEVTNND